MGLRCVDNVWVYIYVCSAAVCGMCVYVICPPPGMLCEAMLMGVWCDVKLIFFFSVFKLVGIAPVLSYSDLR